MEYPIKVSTCIHCGPLDLVKGSKFVAGTGYFRVKQRLGRSEVGRFGADFAWITHFVAPAGEADTVEFGFVGFALRYHQEIGWLLAHR
jgi:hypothetical protein